MTLQTTSHEPSEELVAVDLRAHRRATNLVHESSTWKASSSSQEAVQTVTKKMPYGEPNHPDRNPNNWWTSEDFARATDLIRQYRPTNQLAAPDAGVVAAILPNMLGLDDLRLWLTSSQTLLGSAQGWGLYVRDSQVWATRRAVVMEQYRIAQIAETQPSETQPSPQGQYCLRCGRSGVRQAENDPQLWEWCDCDHALLRRERDPGFVDRSNRNTKFRLYGSSKGASVA